MKKLVVLSTILLTSIAFGQGSETIQSDRPGFANNPFTIGKRYVQIQSGISQLRNFNRQLGSLNSNAFTATNFRFGIAKRTDFGISGSYAGMKNVSQNNTFAQNFGGVNLSLRQNFFKGKGWIPSFTVQIGAGLPIGIGDFGDRFNFNTNILMYQAFGEKISLTTNITSGLDFFKGFGGTNYVLDVNLVMNLGYSLNEKLSVFAEYYSYNTYYDVGVAYLLTKNLQLDLYGGYLPEVLRSNNTSASFIAGGISWRFQRKDKE